MTKRIAFVHVDLMPQVTEIVVPDVMTAQDAVAPTVPGSYRTFVGDDPGDVLVVAAPAPAVVGDLEDQFLLLDPAVNSVPAVLDLYSAFTPKTGLTFEIISGSPPPGSTLVDSTLTLSRQTLYPQQLIQIRATDALGRSEVVDVSVTVGSVPATMAAPVVVPVNSTQFRVTVGPAPANNNSAITLYEISYSTVGSNTTTVVPAQTVGDVLVGGVAAGSLSNVTVHAINAFGPGLYSPPTAVQLVAPSASIGTTSLDGDYVEIDAPAGFTNASLAVVNPAGVTITQTVPSISDAGIPNTRALTILAGYRALVVGTKMRVWCRGNISNLATEVSINIAAGAITQGATSCPAISGAILPAVSYPAHSPRLRLAGIVQGQYDMRVEKDTVDAPFWVEANGYDTSGGGLFEVTVTDGTTTQTQYSIAQSASRYNDFVYMGYAARDNQDGAWLTHDELKALAAPQWAANGNRGLGVLSHTTAFNPNDFANGPLTIRVRLYSHAGGVANFTEESWELFNNVRGVYTFRDVYMSLSGNDTTGNGTVGAPYLTFETALRRAGSPVDGATAFHIPRVFLIGSGNPAAPAVYILTNTTYKIAATLPGITHTYLTIQPAPGSSDRDVHLRPAVNGPAPRVRRIKFKNLGLRIDGLNGWDSREILNASLTYYPRETDPQTVCFDGCTLFHSLGRSGHVFAGSDYSIGSAFGGLNVHWINHVTRDTGRRGHCFLSQGITRNAAILRTLGDTLKGPKGLMFGLYIFDNIAPATTLSIENPEGTFNPGDTVTGVRSTGTATVVEFRSFSTAAGIKHRLLVTGLTGRFKEDDAKKNHEITVASIAGFVTGQPIRVGNGTTQRMVYRIIGNTLRVDGPNDNSVLVTSGQTITQDATGAVSTATANSVSRGGIVSSSGGSGHYVAVHPDVVQVQAFYPQRSLYAPVSGTLAVGQQIRKDGSTATIQALENIAGFGPAITIGGGSVGLFDSEVGQTFSTLTGESFTFLGTYDTAPANPPVNLVLSNVIAVGVEGAPFYAENCSKGMLVSNYDSISVNGSRDNKFQWGRTQQLYLVHVSAVQRPIADRSGNSLGPRAGVHMWGCVGQEIDGPRSGQFVVASHGIDPVGTSNYSDVTTGPYTLVTPVLPDDDAPWFGDFSPVPGQANVERVPPNPFCRYDAFGNLRPSDGTARIGAVQRWITTAPPVVAPTLVASDTASASTVAMPAGQLAGHLLVLNVGRADAGSLATPAGWTLVGSQSIPGSGLVAMFERIATADNETVPTVTGATFSAVSVWANSPGVGGFAVAQAPNSVPPNFGAVTLQGGAKPSALAFIYCRSGTAGTAIAPPTGYTLAPGATNPNGRRAFYAIDVGTIPAISSATSVAATTEGATIHAEIMSL